MNGYTFTAIIISVSIFAYVALSISEDYAAASNFKMISEQVNQGNLSPEAAFTLCAQSVAAASHSNNVDSNVKTACSPVLVNKQALAKQ